MFSKKNFAYGILLLFSISSIVNAGHKKEKENAEKEDKGGGHSSLLARAGINYLTAFAALSNLVPGQSSATLVHPTMGGSAGNNAMAQVEGLHPIQPHLPIFPKPNINLSENVAIDKKHSKNLIKRNLAEEKIIDPKSLEFQEMVEAAKKVKLAAWQSIIDGTPIEQPKMVEEYPIDYSAFKVPDPKDPEMAEKLKFMENIVPYEEKATAKPTPFGPLKVAGTKLVDAHGQAHILRGEALMVSTWFPQFWTPQVINGLACTWNANIIRAPILVNGYLQFPNDEWNRIVTVIDAAINNGAYILVDFHNVLDSANPHSQDYENFIAQGVKFFDAVTRKYPNVPNLLFEIWNEPSHYVIGKDAKGNNVYRDLTWEDILRYHTKVIPAIRKNSPNAVVIAGTIGWSSGVKGDILSKPLKYNNVMYTAHWYTVGEAWNQKQRDQIVVAMGKGLGIFVTEYGTTGLNANDPVDPGQQVEIWWNFMNKEMLGGYVNWELSNQRENSAALAPNCGPGDVGNPWRCLTPSGKLVINHLRSFVNNGVSCFRRLNDEEKEMKQSENEEGNENENVKKHANIPIKGRKQLENDRKK